MKLLLDIGNSRLKSALLNGDSLTDCADLPCAELEMAALAMVFRDLPRPDAVLAANVAGESAAAAVGAFCREQWALIPGYAQVQPRYRGLITEYADPNQLGVDRWLGVLAAWQGRRPACVASCGTALTVDVLAGDGRYLGGYIIPGLRLMQKILIDSTRGIAAHAMQAPTAGPGRSTAECVCNGAGLAAAAIIERVAAETRRNHGEQSRCLITGGAAAEVGSLLRLDFELDPQLVLKGLAVIAQDAEG